MEYSRNRYSIHDWIHCFLFAHQCASNIMQCTTDKGNLRNTYHGFQQRQWISKDLMRSKFLLQDSRMLCLNNLFTVFNLSTFSLAFLHFEEQSDVTLSCWVLSVVFLVVLIPIEPDLAEQWIFKDPIDNHL